MNVRKPTPKQKIQVKYVPSNHGSNIPIHPTLNKMKLNIFWGTNYFIQPIKRVGN